MKDCDVQRLRRLAAQYKEIAILDAQRENLKLWYNLNNKTPIRPTLIFGDIPWHEMNVDDELTLDANHPLAGKTLTFEIEVVSVN